MAKKKHVTPKHLDHLFERKIVTRENYKEFWDGYWGESGPRRRRYVLDFQKALEAGPIEVEEPPKHAGVGRLLFKKKRKSIKRSKAAKKGWITRRRNARRRKK